MHQFNEHHPKLKGFSPFYQYAILPTLLAQEDNRLSRLKDRRRYLIITFIVVLIVLGTLFLYRAPPMAFAGVLFIGGLLLTFRAGVSSGYIKFNTKTKILDEICGFLGWSYQRTFAVSPYIDQFTDLGLLTSSYDFDRLADRVMGSVYGVNFECFQLRLENRGEPKRAGAASTPFQGRILIIDINRKSLAKTIVLQDRGMFNSKMQGSMRRVGFADPVFEKLFEAYSTDQVEARYMLPPDFMQRLIDLKQVIGGKKIRFGFFEQKLLIVIETKNIFDVGDMSKPVTETKRTQIILDEFGAICNVIDAVAKPIQR